MILTEYHASLEAERCWSRTAGLLRTLYHEGWSGFRRGQYWPGELGKRVQVSGGDTMGFVAQIVAADSAMEELRLRCLPAFFLADDIIQHGAPHTDDEGLERRHEWHNDRRTGVADRLGLERGDSRRLYVGAQEFLFWRLEVQVRAGEPEPEIVRECLV